MARRMLSLAAVLSLERRRAFLWAGAIGCSQDSCCRWRVDWSVLQRLRVRSTSKVFRSSNPRDSFLPACCGRVHLLYVRVGTAKVSYEQPTPAGCKSSGFESSNFELGRALATHASRRVIKARLAI